MLKPIPAKILRSTAKVEACTGVDRYQNPAYSTYTVRNVHLQPTNEVRKTTDNTECILRSILFVDAHHSRPVLDWDALFKTAQEVGGDVKVTVRGTVYTIASIDALRDDTDLFHHYEIGLV